MGNNYFSVWTDFFGYWENVILDALSFYCYDLNFYEIWKVCWSSLAEMDVNIKLSPILSDSAEAFGLLLWIFSAPFSLPILCLKQLRPNPVKTESVLSAFPYLLVHS